MTMTRNDFELLAVALKSAHSDIIFNPDCSPMEELYSDRLDGFNVALNAVAEVCKASNARFDKRRFMAACGAHNVYAERGTK
jgi:hypothetical protein